VGVRFVAWRALGRLILCKMISVTRPGAQITQVLLLMDVDFEHLEVDRWAVGARLSTGCT
jgi:hypothetical protein